MPVTFNGSNNPAPGTYTITDTDAIKIINDLFHEAEQYGGNITTAYKNSRFTKFIYKKIIVCREGSNVSQYCILSFGSYCTSNSYDADSASLTYYASQCPHSSAHGNVGFITFTFLGGRTNKLVITKMKKIGSILPF